MIFDVNIGYGVWPFRTTLRTTAPLVRKLTVSGIGTGWVHSMESVWNFDIDRCNQALLKGWKRFPEFKTVPTLHEAYQQSLELLKMAQIPAGIIYPNYHGYALDSLEEIPKVLQRLKKTLVIPLRLEDERNQHPMAQVPAIAVAQVLEFCRKFPDLKVLVLNGCNAEAASLLSEKMENLYCDSAFIDGVTPYRKFEEGQTLDHLLFGSNAPLFEPLASVMKLQEFKGEYDPSKNAAKLQITGTKALL